ncbi:MAG: dockerin type I repeat-containing protein [Candidatus Omnitrophota bacterium]
MKIHKLFIPLISLFIILSAGRCMAEVVYGYVNGDGQITLADASLVLNYTVKAANFTPEQLTAADVTADKTVSAYDAAYILKMVSHLIKEFPVKEVMFKELKEKAKDSLGKGDLINANKLFKQALESYPEDQEANFFYAITRVLVIVQSNEDGPDADKMDSFKELLDRLGVNKDGRYLFNWSASMPLDKNGKPILPENASTLEEIQEYLKDYVLTEINQAQANLDKVKEDFNTDFSYGVFGQNGKVEIDYGDVCLAKACLELVESVLLVSSVYDLNMDNSLLLKGNLEIEFIKDKINAYPNLLTIKDKYSLLGAKEALVESIKNYFKASDFIRSEVDEQNDDLISFVHFISEEKNKKFLDQEIKFRMLLREIKNSLTAEIKYPFSAKPHQLVNLSLLFDEPFNPRDLLTTSGFQGFLKSSLILGQIDNALGSLDSVGESFTYKLTSEDDLLDYERDIDFADVASLRSGLKMTKAVIQILSSYDINIDLLDVCVKGANKSLNIQENISNYYSNFGNLIDSVSLNNSKLAFEASINDSLAAIEFMRNGSETEQRGKQISRILNSNGTINGLIKNGKADLMLNQLKSSLYSSTEISGVTFKRLRFDSFKLDLSRFFDSQPSLRNLLPAFSFYPESGRNTIILDSFPDMTFNGILPEVTQE